jgi:hypothetical protein
MLVLTQPPSSPAEKATLPKDITLTTLNTRGLCTFIMDVEAITHSTDPDILVLTKTSHYHHSNRLHFALPHHHLKTARPSTTTLPSHKAEVLFAIKEKPSSPPTSSPPLRNIFHTLQASSTHYIQESLISSLEHAYPNYKTAYLSTSTKLSWLGACNYIMPTPTTASSCAETSCHRPNTVRDTPL